MDALKEDITEIRNFKQRHNLKNMVVHLYESNMDNKWCFHVADAIEKLIPGCSVSYMIGKYDHELGLYPLITTNSLYLIELKNDGNEILKTIEYFKKRVFDIKKKLSSNFSGNAPKEIVELEKKKLFDFESRWEKASIGYMYI
jgi:valyl-tRNA synthetase